MSDFDDCTGDKGSTDYSGCMVSHGCLRAGSVHPLHMLVSRLPVRSSRPLRSIPAQCATKHVYCGWNGLRLVLNLLKKPGLAGLMRRRIATADPDARDLEFVQLVRSAVDAQRTISDEQLRQCSVELRESIVENRWDRSREDMVQAFALMTLAIIRTQQIEFYDVQLLAGHILASGRVAEMQTGEGKTLTAGLPAYWGALTGEGVHVATTNAYLAERDCDELRPAFELLGMSVGFLPSDHEDQIKRHAYRCDITYGTGYEFGFDFLRDQMMFRNRPKLRLGSRHLSLISGQVLKEREPLQHAHAFAIIDEADSVLIDEATMPLVLSGPSAEQPDPAIYHLARKTADDLQPDVDMIITERTRTVEFTEAGWNTIHDVLNASGVTGLRRPWSEYIQQALRARLFLKRDVDYVVNGTEVHIVDQQTGRIHSERSWRDGLHQAVEICEGVPPSDERSSEARVSRQRYYQFYKQMSGLTGTASGSEPEFKSFYELSVVNIPTHRPSQRTQLPSRFFANSNQRDLALAEDVQRRQQTGQPILVGTRTIAHSKVLSNLLMEMRVPHTVLNGVQDETEAEIIGEAGEPGAVTIATNMAGRGTDIRIHPESLAAGGLHVVAAEHHASRRVDRQLIGRSARQGQPGSCQFFVSAEDEIFQISETDLGEKIQADSQQNGESRKNFADDVKQLQDSLELQAHDRRKSMVQRDNWLESVLDTLARET